jgi:hypothetical protein
MKKKPVLKTAVFSLLPCVLALGLAELAVRVVYYQRNGPSRLGILQVYHSLVNSIASLKKPDVPEIQVDSRRFTEDPILGFKTVPGIHTVRYRVRQKTMVTKEIVGDDGYRTTAPNPSAYEGRPELWFYGCSFTWGESVNNDETFPWLVQSALPGWRVRNLARPAYSNVHALLQLEQSIRNGERLPEIAVFVFNDFHMHRNVAAPSWLAELRPARLLSSGSPDHQFLSYRYPRASISRDGNFWVDYVRLDETKNDGPESDPSYQELITKIVFYRALELCASHEIAPVFAFQSGRASRLMLKYAAQIGYNVVDFSVNLNADGFRYRNLPFDTHPNPSGQQQYFKRILPAIVQLTSRTPRRSPAMKTSRRTDGSHPQRSGEP